MVIKSNSDDNHPKRELGRHGGAGAPYIQSADLFRGYQEIVIEHRGQEYRLRETKQHKLILTK